MCESHETPHKGSIVYTATGRHWIVLAQWPQDILKLITQNAEREKGRHGNIHEHCSPNICKGQPDAQVITLRDKKN